MTFTVKWYDLCHQKVRPSPPNGMSEAVERVRADEGEGVVLELGTEANVNWLDCAKLRSVSESPNHRSSYLVV